MPHRVVAAQELGALLSCLAHADRVRLIAELRPGERDVTSLCQALQLPQARVSQQLAVLRAHRTVQVRRDGRRIFYRLTQPRLAEWLFEGLSFVQTDAQMISQLEATLDEARTIWARTDHSAAPAQSDPVDTTPDPDGSESPVL